MGFHPSGFGVVSLTSILLTKPKGVKRRQGKRRQGTVYTALPAHYLMEKCLWAGNKIRASASDTGLTAARVSASRSVLLALSLEFDEPKKKANEWPRKG